MAQDKQAMMETYRISLDDVVDIDQKYWEELTSSRFVMAGSLCSDYDIPSENVWPALANGYENLTGEAVSPTPTHAEREEYFHANFDLTEWIEMTDDQRDVYTNVLMGELYGDNEEESSGEF